jgi:predicted GTPase
MLLITAGKLADVEVWNWWCIKFEKQAEILIDKYYSFVKVIHKAVLIIFSSSFGKSLLVNSIFEQISIVGDNKVI